MAKPPKIDAEQFGAAIDAMTTIVGLMFSMTSSEEQRTAMLGLLDQLAANGGDTPADEIRAFVGEATANAIRGIAAIAEKSRLAGSEATS